MIFVGKISSNMDIGQVIPPVVGAITGSVITWFLRDTEDLKQKLEKEKERTATLSSDLKREQREVSNLLAFKKKYEDVKSRLESSVQVKEYCQPVILVGQRAVGKSSLLALWHTPWNCAGLKATQTHKVSVVPIYDFEQSDREPHFADRTISTRVDIHLQLRVHDFPGELKAQENIIEQAKEETSDFRVSTNKNLGVVLICMFDASEAIAGIPLQSTIDYYNGDLFKNLKTLVSNDNIGLERLVLVFNKSDILRQKFPSEKDSILLEKCLETFMPLISSLRSTCNPEKVCEVLTNFDRDIIANNRGEAIVMGEAARNFVKEMAGQQAVQQVIKNNASTNAARFF
jgi:hypothetical protein